MEENKNINNIENSDGKKEEVAQRLQLEHKPQESRKPQENQKEAKSADANRAVQNEMKPKPEVKLIDKKVVQIHLREGGDIEYFLTNRVDFHLGDKVILEADRGLDYGDVVSEPENVQDVESLVGQELRKVIRRTNDHDLEQIKKNLAKTKDLMNICTQKIKEQGLVMKLVNAEYSFDRSKIIFYFTSESRVDFRNLVKDLASIFRVRIELRQIGVRDEARLLGGFGPCGKELCCMSFLKDFNPVTIKMAKIQNLPLNPTKISGLCGRLMCCLSFENECYKMLCKEMPKIGKEVTTEFGKGRVVAVYPLKGVYTVDLGEGKFKDIKVCPKRENEEKNDKK